MREMKWQINVNRRRPFITGLHGRGRCVWQRERTDGARKRVGTVRTYVQRVYVRGRGHTTIYRIGKTISEK